jgi:hypothetical protein
MSKFWETLKPLLPAIEMASNLAVSVLVPGGPAWAALLTQLENAVNPAIQNIGTAQSAQSTLMTIYGTIIGIVTVLKATPNLPADKLAQIDAFLVAAQAGTAGYIAAESGFVASNYAPVTPIA